MFVRSCERSPIRGGCTADVLVVHGEPGEDKVTYANDVARWILARSGWKAKEDDPDSKSKL